MRNQKGFTLLELMIVLAIVAIAVTMAYPVYNAQKEKAQVKRAGRDLVTNMQTARINALKQGKDWAIQFDTGTQSYRLISDRGPDGDWNTADDVEFRTVSLSTYGPIEFGSAYGGRPDATNPDDGVSFNGNRVEFNPDGTSMSGTIYVKHPEGYTFAVGSLSNTGRIKTWVNYGSGWED